MTRNLPLIGVPVALSPQDIEPGIPEKSHFQYVKQSYIDVIIAAGGMPVVIPAFESSENIEMLRHWVTMLDGLFLPGGGDPDAGLWGESNTHGVNINPLRDAIEIEFCRRCFASDIPILGVCRGIQMIAVALGGDIWQDYSLGKLADHRQGSHDLNITTGTLLHGILDTSRMPVNTNHHQVVRKMPPEFTISATATGDDAIEAIEYSGEHDRYVLGVQWHPEDMHSLHAQAIYGSFIRACTHDSQ